MPHRGRPVHNVVTSPASEGGWAGAGVSVGSGVGVKSGVASGVEGGVCVGASPFGVGVAAIVAFVTRGVGVRVGVAVRVGLAVDVGPWPGVLLGVALGSATWPASAGVRVGKSGSGVRVGGATGGASVGSG